MFKRILLPIDLQEPRPNQTALDVALDFARRDGAELFIMDVLPGYGMPLVASYFPPSARQAALKETEQKMAEFVRTHIDNGVKVTQIVQEGKPYDQILREAKKNLVDLIVIPSQRMGSMEGFMMGSTAEKVVRHAHCTVIVVREWPENERD
ncbi:MAG: universal stress protein [Gammaproteobacteria bacterium]